ncbi:hypothetical protein L596_016939 [Steinernema carpocapsae]|uniref:Uncharacterized protein n=1 Tax=Steinernema carpocapsae TaxID=34508 RepID=A0A4U5N0C6_STECR|nr:hypothetical protein L596_016939 [Steinernema carpocapsae]
MDLRINYALGNHFDISNETSIAGEGGSKMLIGVVNGNKIYRKKSNRKTGLYYDKDTSLAVFGKVNCFFINGCDLAFGKELFYDILVIPKEKIR